MNELEQEIIDTLSNEPSPLDFEDIQPEDQSPLNQAVKEKDIANTKSKDWNIWKPDSSTSSAENETVDDTILDAPEQEIEAHTDPDKEIPKEEEAKPFQIPKETAKQSANALLGMANNMLEVGGGFVITIKKHKDFYDFDDVVTLIDQQNSKNIQRIKLDKEDKALLRPLIMAVMQEKAKTLTPTQQLTGAIVSILLKKAQIVMQVRAENNILVDRILNIIKEQKQDKQETQPESDLESTDTFSSEKDQETNIEEISSEEYVQDEFFEETPFPEDIVEVAQDNPTSNDI